MAFYAFNRRVPELERHLIEMAVQIGLEEKIGRGASREWTGNPFEKHHALTLLLHYTPADSAYPLRLTTLPVSLSHQHVKELKALVKYLKRISGSSEVVDAERKPYPRREFD